MIPALANYEIQTRQNRKLRSGVHYLLLFQFLQKKKILC